MKKNRISTKQTANSPKIEKISGKESMCFAKEQIMKGNTNCVISILLELLETDCRLPAAFELAYFFFQEENYYLAEIYLDIVINEEKNQTIKKQAQRMKLYLQKKEGIFIDPLQEDYYERQIVKYNPDEVCHFLSNHRISEEGKLSEGKFYYFYQAKTILESIKPYLNQRNTLHGYDALDHYHMFIPNAGIIKDTIASTIQITTIRGTFDIVDTKPIEETQKRLIIPNPPIEWK